jgi:SapC
MHLVELSRGAHAGLRIRAAGAQGSAASQHLIPIVVSEFRKAAIQYPIVFAKSSETGRFAPYVLTGLAPEENLFWSGTELDVAYVPLNVRRQPFYVGASSGDSGGVLCIDVESPCLDESGDTVLVNPDGSDSAYLKSVLAVLGELVAGRGPTEQFVATLLSLDLLAPILLDIVLDDGTPLKVQGLYGLDEDKLRQVSQGELSGLRDSGRLDLVYAVVLASGQIFNLVRLKNRRIALGRAWRKL